MGPRSEEKMSGPGMLGGDVTLPQGDGDVTAVDTFNLQVVSPSVGVNGPLSFSQLPTSMTVKQLKEKIRGILAMRPPDEHQRLIHRGRLLSREGETMVEVFGLETLRTSDLQTIHLVLRPPTGEDSHPHASMALPDLNIRPSQSPLRNLSHGGSESMPGLDRPVDWFVRSGFRTPSPAQIPPSMQPLPNRRSYGSTSRPLQSARISTPPRLPSPLQQVQRILTQEELDRIHSNHLQDPAVLLQQIVAQHHRDQAAMGTDGVQLGTVNTVPRATHPRDLYIQGPRSAAAGQPGGNNALPYAGRPASQPGNTRMVSHEVHGPAGVRWQVTINETTAVFPPVHLQPHQVAVNAEAPPMAEVQNMIQNILRAADGGAPALQGASTSRHVNTPPNLPSGTATNRGIDQPASSDPLGMSPSADARMVNPRTATGATHPTTNNASHSLNPAGPIVYILSSPSGPQGLLLSPSGNGLQPFYTVHQLESQNHIQPPQNPQHSHINAFNPQGAAQEIRRRHQDEPRPANAQGFAAPQVAHPPNPPAGAVAAQIWQPLWLIVRLMGFVWFFTSGSDSWWRTILISCLAVIFFIISTGVLNSVAEQIWGPIRLHLEALLPLAAPPVVPRAAPRNDSGAVRDPGAASLAQRPANEVAEPGMAAAEVPPDPAQVAARLVDQHWQANLNWLSIRIRRAEHATLLFLASLIPGVGERHIAARAAEENLALLAQRQRQEAAAAALAVTENTAEADQETSEGHMAAADEDAGENVPAGGEVE